MKKGIKKLIILFFLLVFVGNLSACRGGLYMDDFINVRWTCSDINLQFTYTADNLEKATGTLIKDNKTIDVVCMFTLSKNIEIYDKSEYDLTTGDIVCPALLIGHYKIKDDVATVTIVEDNLFNGDYLNKVIYLQKAPLS